MKKSNKIKFMLATLLLASASAFFFVNSRSGFLSELSLTGAASEINISDREKSETDHESARIPGLVTLARLLELAEQFVNRGI